MSETPAPRRHDAVVMLSDLVVIDLTRALAGPHAAMMLADLGARVIKVEQPDGGDESRSWGPPFVGADDDPVSTYFMSCNRNKESVTADLKSEDGKELLTRLVARADVLMENFRTGVLDRLGFSVERLHEINPRLVILSITGFGHDGPEGGRAGYDQIAQGEAGLMSLTGPPPTSRPGSASRSPTCCPGCTARTASSPRCTSGTPPGAARSSARRLLASVVGVHAFQGTRWTVAHEVPHAIGNHHPSIAPYGLFHTADAPIQIACGNETSGARWPTLLGIDDPRFASNRQRVGLRDELVAVLERALAADGAESWLARLAELGIPAGKVRTLDDVYGWDQTRSQGLVVEVDHPTVGPVELPGPPLRFDDNAHAGDRDRPPPAAPARRAQRRPSGPGSTPSTRSTPRRRDGSGRSRRIAARGLVPSPRRVRAAGTVGIRVSPGPSGSAPSSCLSTVPGPDGGLPLDAMPRPCPLRPGHGFECDASPSAAPQPHPRGTAVSDRLSATELIDLVLDEGSWASWDTPPERGPVSEQYAAELPRRRGEDRPRRVGGHRRGADARPPGRRGRLRVPVPGRLDRGRRRPSGSCAAIERATAEGLPLLAAPVSGGTRMQEGTVAFVQMVKISAAIAAHKSAGLPYLVYLRNPTTGGVMASWGSLGHVTVAEPGALVGFLGPRVYEALYGRPFPHGVQTSENLYAHGLIDAVVPPEEIADILDRALTVLLAPSATSRGDPPTPSTRRSTTSTPGTRSPARGGRTGPAYGGCSGTPPPTSSRSTAPARASSTPGC